MSENPFKIISPTDEVPKGLKAEVMGSVKVVMLTMRFIQLFIGDFANVLFDKVRLVASEDEDAANETPNDNNS